MIINDEPSPIKRLCAETQKMIKSSLRKIRSYTRSNIYIVLTSLVIVGASGLFLFETVSSKEEKPVVDEKAQMYNACVLSKNLLGEQNVEDSFINLDEECIKLSQEGKIIEDKQDVVTQEIAEILEGTPMEQMAPFIAKKDQKVAALIVGIANIESQMGRRSPSKNGQDCYNYWGYKTSGSRGQAMGHACFGSPEEAVNTIAKRLEYFVYETGRETPSEMVYPWKCGGSCATHSPESVSRWIGTVNIYYSKIIAIENLKNEQIKQKTQFLSKK